MKKILIFLCFIVLSTLAFSQTFKVTEYRNSEQSKFSKTDGTLIFNNEEIKIFSDTGKLIMDFKINSIDNSKSYEIICSGIETILDEFMIVKITYNKTSRTFDWTIIYIEGYAIFKTINI